MLERWRRFPMIQRVGQNLSSRDEFTLFMRRLSDVYALWLNGVVPTYLLRSAELTRRSGDMTRRSSHCNPTRPTRGWSPCCTTTEMIYDGVSKYCASWCFLKFSLGERRQLPWYKRRRHAGQLIQCSNIEFRLDRTDSTLTLLHMSRCGQK
ncbi:hypothetical protein EV356DRAFT_68751 [Viridothelium virens]|uniref:Uncharacterized protein n=1 Tax=Viridothelium virens TaxID=1048519 RepID=A0A6A6HFR1_VIRVR|nr:hypothetical protein EV356DRAFT_68751 [Viridothelium virens]